MCGLRFKAERLNTCVHVYSMFMNMQVVNKIAGGRSSRAATAHTNAFEDDDGGSGFCARAGKRCTSNVCVGWALLCWEGGHILCSIKRKGFLKRAKLASVFQAGMRAAKRNTKTAKMQCSSSNNVCICCVYGYYGVHCFVCILDNILCATIWIQYS